jgi:hypothetical protein
MLLKKLIKKGNEEEGEGAHSTPAPAVATDAPVTTIPVVPAVLFPLPPLVAPVWLSLVLVGCRLCSFSFHLCPFSFLVFVRFLFVLVHACPAVHPYPLIWLSFMLVHTFRACALLLCACLRLLHGHLGLFGFVWAHLSVSNTHLVHRS